MTRDNTKTMAAFGRAVSSAIVLLLVGALQVAASVPIAAYLHDQDWPSLLCAFAALNIITAYAYYKVWGFWFRTPRWS